MWIRSQDKQRLINILAIKVAVEVGRNIVYAYINRETEFFLGKYETRERAIEVISEIQFQVQQGAKEKNWVYEMPEK